MTDRRPPEETEPEAGPLSLPDPWTLVAGGYSHTTRKYLEQFSTAGLARLRYGAETEVIDVACGPGTTAIPLSPKVKGIACVDFSDGMLAELRKNAAAARATNLDIRRADGQALPFPDMCFDIGISMFGLMFFPDRRKGFSELYRVLRPGGQVLVSSWAPADFSPLMRTVVHALRPEAAWSGQPRPPAGLEDPSIFEREMRSAGFSEIGITPLSRSLAVESAGAFWRDTVRGTAPIALLKRNMDATAWDLLENQAIKRLARALGRGPTSLSSTAYLAIGRRPDDKSAAR